MVEVEELAFDYPFNQTIDCLAFGRLMDFASSAHFSILRLPCSIIIKPIMVMVVLQEELTSHLAPSKADLQHLASRQLQQVAPRQQKAKALSPSKVYH